MKRTCKQCGKEFELTQGEIDFYNSKNLSLPKRCKECREANKAGESSSGVHEKPVQTAKLSSSSRSLLIGVIVVIIALIAIFGVPQLGGNSQQTADSGSTEAASTVDSGSSSTTEATSTTNYTFASTSKLNEHYNKHGKDMGFASAEEYEQAASDVINNPDALHKTEAEDGDDVYYLESTNEIVFVSASSGHIRSYFCPDSGKAYFDRQ